MTMLPKVLFVGPLPPPFAGPEMVTRNLLESKQLQSALEVLHIDTTLRANNADKGKFDRAMVSAYLRYLGKYLRVLLRRRPECLVYLPTSASLKGWIRDGTTLLLARLFRVKVLLLFQGGHFNFFYTRQSPPLRLLIKGLLRSCRCVLVQAEALKKQFNGLLQDHQLACLPNSIDHDFFSRFNNQRYEAKARVRVLFVGHLSYAKGYCDLLKVIPRLADLPVEFAFMGAKKKVERNVHYCQATGKRLAHEDPDDCYAEYIAPSPISERLDYLGDRVYGEEKIAAFQTADIFVLPSYSEGFSTAILEAMAAGLPLVVTKVGAAPEIITPDVNGYLLLPGDLDALEKALRELISNPEKRRVFGENNRRLCGERFLNERIAEQLLLHLTTVRTASHLSKV